MLYFLRKKILIILFLVLCIPGISRALTDPEGSPGMGANDAEPVLNVGVVNQIKTGPLGIGRIRGGGVSFTDFLGTGDSVQHALRVKGPLLFLNNVAIQMPSGSVGYNPAWIRNTNYGLDVNGAVTTNAALFKNIIIQSGVLSLQNLININGTPPVTEPLCVDNITGDQNGNDAGTIVRCTNGGGSSLSPAFDSSASSVFVIPPGGALQYFRNAPATVNWDFTASTLNIASCDYLGGTGFGSTTAPGLSGTLLSDSLIKIGAGNWGRFRFSMLCRTNADPVTGLSRITVRTVDAYSEATTLTRPSVSFIPTVGYTQVAYNATANFTINTASGSTSYIKIKWETDDGPKSGATVFGTTHNTWSGPIAVPTGTKAYSAVCTDFFVAAKCATALATATGSPSPNSGGSIGDRNKIITVSIRAYKSQTLTTPTSVPLDESDYTLKTFTIVYGQPVTL